MQIEPLAVLHSPFATKFGIPRQSGITNIECYIEFLPDYRIAEALHGIEDMEYLWLLWQFDTEGKWQPTVRPPRLGGNSRMGVFATRSPYRPNPIGLSSVKLLRTEQSKEKGPLLWVSGADLMDGTKILDIKPYLPYTDSHPDALCGFAGKDWQRGLQVECDDIIEKIPETLRQPLLQTLEQDPRPAYHDDPTRVYGFTFAGYEIKFIVAGGVLKVLSIES